MAKNDENDDPSPEAGLPAPDPLLRFRGLRFDVPRNAFINADSYELALRPQSADVLQYLASRAGYVVSKSEMFDAIWPGTAVTDDSIVQCIAEIRKAIGDTKRTTLRTVARKGYVLMPDDLAPIRHAKLRGRTLLAAGIAIIVLLSVVAIRNTSGEPQFLGPPSISISESSDRGVEQLNRRLVVMLSRYRSIRLLSEAKGDYILEIRPDEMEITAKLTRVRIGEVVYARTFAYEPGNFDILAAQLAAAVASPTSGAIARSRMAEARQRPVAELSRYECFLHAFALQGNQNNDEIAQRTAECLDHVLAADPRDARAWALKGALLAQQFFWGVGLVGPARTNQNLRLHMPGEALAAAVKGEALLDMPDSAIYFALAKSYYSACERDKTIAAARRAVAINPYDPNILGAVGNWIFYVGALKEGADLARRAIEIEPVAYAKWWYWPIAKEAWRAGDYDAAYEYFLRSHDENNWLSHLQMAYTLPFLGRLDEARASIARLREIRPDMTRADARTAYERWCFDDAFIVKMDDALKKAGLP